MSEPRKTLLLVGGTSDIGRATALRYGQAGWNIVLAGRNAAELQRSADDIATRSGATVSTAVLDLLETGRFQGFLEGLDTLPDTAVCVVGELGSQTSAEKDMAHATRIIRANYEGPALMLGLIAEAFIARGSGTIVAVSSVAGDRGRASNYVYGSAKAGLTAFLSGLRNRLHPAGIRVITVKPGFVRTQMTAGMKLPGPLTAEPEEVGNAIFRAAEQKGGDIIYVRPAWRLIMTGIGLVPERLFKRLRL